MSEYWKSTPKYWCKHCKTFVRDTKLEKTNHEATPKHQGNLKRFLRDLHKGHEREERDKQRAKDEVDRLNGVVSGSGPKGGSAPWERRPGIPPPSVGGNQQATPADRKRQLAQLAEMGVAVPEDFRREMAMAGDWQTTSERLVYDNDFVKKEDGDDVKADGLNIGVRKRKFEGLEEEAEAGETVVRKGWGSTIRNYPGAGGGEDDDLDMLLNNAKKSTREGEGQQQPRSSQLKLAGSHVSTKESQPNPDAPSVKKEESVGSIGVSDMTPNQIAVVEATIKQEENPPDSGVVFKKRKARAIKQK